MSASRSASTIAAIVALIATGGCGARGEAPETRQPVELPVRVMSDTGRGGRLEIALPDSGLGPRASAWLARVAPTRAPVDAPLPEPAPGLPEGGPTPAPPPLEVDDELKPPIPRERAPLAVPPRARGSVELDVRVDESGAVSDALWVGGRSDSALVQAAVDCALAMRFYPALRSGRPIAVWCRQRFDFESR